MIALGLGDSQIGLIATIGMVFQVFMAIISGPITDKLGRKKTTFIFDLIFWSVPTLIWAFAQNFYFFLAAAIINSVMNITMNSWTCLLVEDARKDQLVSIWSWITVAMILSGLFAPLAGLLVDKLTLVPAVRIIYGFAFISMTLIFIILNKYCDETKQGKIRMEETRRVPLLHLIKGYKSTFSTIIKSPYMLNAFFIYFILLVY